MKNKYHPNQTLCEYSHKVWLVNLASKRIDEVFDLEIA